MSKRKLYHSMNTYKNKTKITQDTMDILSYCDGGHTKEDIAKIFGLKEEYVLKILSTLKRKKIIFY